MTAAADPGTQPRTPLGYSVGRWDGKTLVVETSRVSAPYLNADGVPLGAGARFVERFTPTRGRQPARLHADHNGSGLARRARGVHALVGGAARRASVALQMCRVASDKVKALRFLAPPFPR